MATNRDCRIEIALVEQLKQKMLLRKADLMNRLRMKSAEIKNGIDLRGDEIDQTLAVMAENTLLVFQNRIREELLEIESALARIQQGTFGICEETEEPIERERLIALPWTRLSIEGAEIREAVRKRFA
ncbi:MAG: TraR/DksA family transcriptional regulator [Bdellovibrionales bacterium]